MIVPQFFSEVSLQQTKLFPPDHGKERGLSSMPLSFWVLELLNAAGGTKSGLGQISGDVLGLRLVSTDWLWTPFSRWPHQDTPSGVV